MESSLLYHCPLAPRVAAEPRKAIRKRILLAEDQRSVREAVNLLLGLDEHTVVEAADGTEALALFQGDHFDLVITDFDMPKMKGNELAARIKQLLPSQPILMITAYAEELGDTNNPVDAILDKPFHLADLRRAMAKLMS
jgi:CheY-like chemotaxis protein